MKDNESPLLMDVDNFINRYESAYRFTNRIDRELTHEESLDMKSKRNHHIKSIYNLLRSEAFEQYKNDEIDIDEYVDCESKKIDGRIKACTVIILVISVYMFVRSLNFVFG